MLGWQPLPTYAELIGYVVYLVPAAIYVLWPAGVRVRARASMASGSAVLVLLLVLVLAGCGGSGGAKRRGAAAGTKTVELKLTDAGCAPAQLKLDAGRTTFKVTNAGTGRVSELEILKGARILGEKENLVAGLSGSFTLTLQPGEYTLSCPGGATAATGVVNVGGQAVAADANPQLQAAVAGYNRYVHTNAVELVTRVKAFVAAVKAGDVEKAKDEFAKARVPYETIEPVAESFGNLDPEIDARVNDVAKGQKWTGFHRIEQALWEKHTTEGMGPIADKLLADVKTLEAKTRTLAYQPDELANGANGLLDEVASSKITGEEDRYSHTDLSDFLANVTGSQTTFGLLAPALKAKDPAARDRHRRPLRRRPAGAQDARRRAASFPSYDTVDDARAPAAQRPRGRAGQAAEADLGRARPVMRALVAAIVGLLVLAAPAGAATLPGDIGAQYRQAVRAHDATLAGRLRTETRLIAKLDPRYTKLAATVDRTRNRFRPWPLASEVDALAPPARAPKAHDYAAIRHDLDAGTIAAALDARAQAATSRRPRAQRRRLGLPDRARPGRGRHRSTRSSPRSTPPSRPTATSR